MIGNSEIEIEFDTSARRASDRRGVHMQRARRFDRQFLGQIKSIAIFNLSAAARAYRYRAVNRIYRVCHVIVILIWTFGQIRTPEI